MRHNFNINNINIPIKAATQSVEVVHVNAALDRYFLWSIEFYVWTNFQEIRFKLHRDEFVFGNQFFWKKSKKMIENVPSYLEFNPQTKCFYFDFWAFFNLVVLESFSSITTIYVLSTTFLWILFARKQSFPTV